MTGMQEKAEALAVARGLLISGSVSAAFWLALGMVLWAVLR